MAPKKESLDLMSRTSLEYIYHHLFLPPKLPGTDDSSQKNEAILLDFVQQSLERFLPDRQDGEVVKVSISMMKCLRTSRNPQGYLRDAGVKEVLQGLSAHDGSLNSSESDSEAHQYFAAPVAVLHITEQNAGILISRKSDSVCFEMFELSPTNEAATSTRGRLVRHFPATAVEIPLADFESEAFRTVVTKTLTKMSQQALRETKPMVKRGKQEQDERRETADPMIVTELFTCMLRGCGREVSVDGICKSTREDVMGKDSKPPWRRSSLWLLIRVALQLTMARLSGDDGNTYKEFMAFLMAQVLDAANQQQKIASDVLQTMSTKVSRRLCKLQSPSDGPWLREMQRIVSKTSETVNERWKNIRERAEPSLNLEELSKFKMKENIDFTLKNMDTFLDSIARRETATHESKFRPTSQLIPFARNQLPVVKDWCQAYIPFHLLEIESWVSNNLQTWIDDYMPKADNPVRDLKQLIETYHNKAVGYYSARPEGVSRMILTIGELWYAADVATIHELPLLADYDPQIPTMVWQALLLSSMREMERLQHLEAYILERKNAAQKLNKPSIFLSFGEPGSFAVEYFRGSTRHQQIKYEIEADATVKRQEKQQEFRKVKAEYTALMQKHAESECDVSNKRDDRGRLYVHSSSCRRCALEAKAKALAVFVHEWPLPENELEAQATVVEMAVPEIFAEWRDLTVYFIHDVLLSHSEDSPTPSTSYSLRTYQPLKPWYTSKRHCRIHVRSAAKPNAVIHRRAISVEHSVESDICLNSGLLYRYYDENLGSFFSGSTATDRLAELCTLKLPERAEVLNRFLCRTWRNPDGEPPNEVIASQHECPDWMSLGEFKTLAGLPYGHKIQWMSILTQLAMPKIDFNTPEAATFLLQMSLQAGPESSNATRSTHARLCDAEFGRQMLEALRKCVLRVRENWESHTALWSFTFLAARLLSLASKDLSQSLLDLLEQSRAISYNWVRTLLERAQQTSNEEQRKGFLGTALSIALVCAESFNVYDGYLPQILHDSKHASILVECSIIINDNAPLKSEDDHILQDIMLDRWRYTMHRARPILVEQNASGNSFLSDATQRRWRYCKSASSWVLSAGTNFWYQTTMKHLKMHLNILTGELLVNGLPLSRLPLDYESHDDYQRLFKGLFLHVMPSMHPGMTFCTTQSVHGHTIHFGKQGQDLLIRLEDSGSSFDFIPPRVFSGLLPDSFVNEYAHWYNSNIGFVEFCPLRNPFPVEASKWHLEKCVASWKLCREDEVFLLAPSSGLAQHIASIVAHLEAPLSLHMLYDEKKSCLEIEIPRLQLQFSLNDGESIIRSRQFRDMHVDRDQSVGTLVGFKSKLVLRSDQDPPTRMLIIPEGEVEFKRRGGDSIHDHTIVSLIHGTGRRVQAYQMDELLGRFVANTKVESKLYLAYIHALTSFCLPDPFLGRRGTEEALEILGSASVRAPTALSPTACNILDLIAGLAPSRQYYPDDSRMMQNVTWSSQLSLSTQDDRFFKITDDIFQRCSEIEFLYPKSDARPAREPHTTMELVQRAISRNARQHLSEFGAEGIRADGDETYRSRDTTRSDRAARATEMAVRAFHSRQGLIQPVAGAVALHLYKLMSMGKLVNQRGAPSKRDMEYDSMWLQKPSAFISSYWCQLHSAFRDNQQWLNKMELMVWITTVAYSADNDEQVTQALLAMALSPSVAAAPLPPSDSHDLSKGYVLQPSTIDAAATPHIIKFKMAPEVKSRARTGRGNEKTADQLKRDYGKDKTQAINIFRDRLARQWPCQVPKQPSDYHMEAFINVPRAMKSILQPWRAWWANKNFKEYLEGFVAALKEIPVETVTIEKQSMTPMIPNRHQTQRVLFARGVFCHEAPDINTFSISTLQSLVQKAEAEPEENEKLTRVVDFLESKASLQYEHRYLKELRQSLSSLEDYSGNNLAQDDARAALLRQHLAQCETRYESIYNSLIRAAQPFSKSETSSPEDVVDAILSEANFQPRISPVFFLRQLKNSSCSKLPGAWKDAIIKYGLAVTALQKAKRLIQFQNDPIDLLRELENCGHQDWSPHDHPEWLLVECESGILIRQVQQQIAQQMIQPPGGDNAVMQLNMGEGKSSVIVPIVSTALGDGLKLVRVIVAKPQAKQMYQMLVSKLSGLLNRPVYQLPFSRDVRMDESRAAAIHRLLINCQKEGGVLLVQPEHLLSLQLMELELALSGQSSLSEQMMNIRRLFEDSSRDIVDESDENFSVKFELIYTLGEQGSIEHSPDRWIVVQEILSLIRHFGAEVKIELPQSIDFDDRHDERFPRIRTLRPDAEKAILNRVAEFICETGMAGFPIARQPPKIRNAIRKYITQWDLSPEESEEVEHGRFWDESTINHILLLRGLLAGGILAFALSQKRWRVNYGLDPNREKMTKLAVPYKAKDSPTPRSEFSHPDIVIVLTCLSYYYGGLEDQALFDSLGLLIRSDNADLEYQAWVKTAPTLPEACKHLQGINLKDRIHCTSTVFPHLRYSKAAIDYYLCRMVFAKECKEFPYKLTASGWDLAKKKKHSTTGFSGTNDSRYVLPLDIKQLELPDQNHTNALVLKYLLRPENSIALMTEKATGATFDSQSLLETLTTMSSKPRVILDVGAQVIDLTNLELARTWLGHYRSDEKTQAVIFFNDFDEMVVLDKSGKVEELQTSPFAEQLEQCLVFLDDAHTRGTDLRLPADYRAAVTLGAHVTKDRLVQACMRMRKLGKGQSVVFFIPREIEQKICLLRGQERSASANITVEDVLCWAITETCNDLRRAVPLWLSQGLRFTKQQALWSDLTNQDDDAGRLECAEKFKDDEAQSLDKRYRPRQAGSDVSSMIDSIGSRAEADFRSRCQEFGLMEIQDASFHEEQERELSPEMEQERQVEKPPRAEPAEHGIHPGLEEFIVNGVYPGDPFQPAFMALETTSAAEHLDVAEFSSNILVTQDFSKTVNGDFGPGTYSDAFQRPVQWILSAQRDPNILVVVSPYEVQQLLSAIEQSRHVTLHLYSSRVNLGCDSLDSLNLYNLSKVTPRRQVPRHVISRLCQFSGQLYLSSFADYVKLCDSLGLAWKPANDEVVLGPDGFIPPELKDGDIVNRSGFSKSPVRFLKVLMAKIRQDSEHIEKTHMGRILEGVRLLESDFEA